MEKSSTLWSSIVILLFLVLSLATMNIRAQEVDDESEFDYIEGSEKGPENWGDIKEEWATCKTGQMQSPIDLRRHKVEIVPPSEEILRFYKPAKAMLRNRGHDIAIKWKGKDNKIQINGTDYILQQAHWHSPSEHTVHGKRFPLELHLVHQSTENEIAVIGLLYEFGQPDLLLSKLMKKIQLIPNATDEICVGKVNPAEIEMGKKFYRYMGSLTTPPCSEGVLWTVNKPIGTVSKEQIVLLRKAVNDHAEGNARPLQPVNGRKVHLYSAGPLADLKNEEIVMIGVY